MHITHADFCDLPALLELQYIAYQSEAELVGSQNIPPLKQTVHEIQTEFETCVFLKAIDENGGIIGSVRARSDEGTLYIGRLIVRPDQQGKGIGTALMLAIEKASPHARYELFTSSKSVRNIALYERLGYVRVREEEVSPGLTFVYLEKRG